MSNHDDPYKGLGLVESYRGRIVDLLASLESANQSNLMTASKVMADRIADDHLIYVYGPGGHSNLAAQEVFFRAGGLMHISAILDEGTLLSSGALRSMAIERTPGYGRIVVERSGIGDGDVLILVNAYGINAALIDAALTARQAGAYLIGVSSRRHADETAPDHPARHPSKKNLHDVVDLHIDSQVPVGDAVIDIDNVSQKTGPISTFANAFLMNSLVILTISELANRGIDPPIWRSGNAPGGDQANETHIDDFVGRIKWL